MGFYTQTHVQSRLGYQCVANVNEIGKGEELLHFDVLRPSLQDQV